MDASIITSLGTCKLVTPLSEFTMAKFGPSVNAFSKAASISKRCVSSNLFSFCRMLSYPLLGLTPIFLKTLLYFSKTSAKNKRIACPKIIGSLTFIIVAFMCRESKTPEDFAS